ncbi:hypothetical protein EJD97_018224 [Solanum chilense]|uniref:RING-type E3 ubiquitin transferase n=1 Tax=Solanum chilense TaxID=4083 RepID=A0A6N2B3Y7_SOLCI|nr:hypothetical protein EJD97_018224 [Solanum chilense]
MITALISICIVIFFVATILRIYIRRRQAQGLVILYTTSNSRISDLTSVYTTSNSRISDLTSVYTTSNSRISNLTSVVVSQVDPPRNGLDPTIIASLPLFLYKRNDHDNDIIECSICLSIIEDGELVRVLPNCKHNFHVECIDKWFNYHSTYPVCRTEAESRLLPEPREGVVNHTLP